MMHVSLELDKAVLPVAGRGTRMLPFTKEQPKEMLPVYARDHTGIAIKPIVQIIFEQLYDVGFREFCFIVGRGKRVIEDHFTVNYSISDAYDKILRRFYRKVENSRLAWVNQPRPMGFGHAVLQAESFCGNSAFLVHAGDVSIFGNQRMPILERMKRFYYDNDPDVTIASKRITNLQVLRQHGIVLSYAISSEKSGGFGVKQVFEKPKKPPSDLAIMPMYIFKPSIFKALRKTGPDRSGELQLTDAIQYIIDKGGYVATVPLRDDEIRIDVGTPDSYLYGLTSSYKFSKQSQKLVTN